MRLAIIGALLLVVGSAAVVAGILTLVDVIALIDRVAPILLFVAAMTVVTELASQAGIFQSAARRFRHWGRGQSVLLWFFLAVFAVLSTIFLSLDTTAVLLTPVVVSVSRQAGLPVLPFALTTVWLANTASLMLPISNLTNLLAQHSLGDITPAGFAALMWAPSLAAILVPVAFAGIVFRRDFRRRYLQMSVGPIKPEGGNEAEAVPPPADRVLLRVAALVLALLLTALVSGAPVWIPAVIAAAVLAVAFAWRRPRVLKASLLPWSLLLFASGLFLVMDAAEHLGASTLASHLAGQGQGVLDLMRLAATGAVGSNVLNNLPAYLLAEPLAQTPQRMAALLIGVNAGPLITPWASLATLLWHDRLVRMNVPVSWKGYAFLGFLLAPLTVLAAVAALAATGS